MRYFEINTMPPIGEEFCFVRTFPSEIGAINHRIMMGISVRNEYPDDVRVFMDPETPNVKLPDLVGNTLNLLLVSARFKQIVSEIQAEFLECLPISIYNHKKRLASPDYFIINPLEPLDCLDMDRSLIEWFEGQVVELEKPVISIAKMNAAMHIFRIREDPMRYVISEELGRALLALQPTNLLVHEIPVA